MAESAIRAFAGGEISESLLARSDTIKYQTGLRTCRNFIVQKFGGVSNRPGFQYICEVKDSSKAVRLIKFVFNNDQTYVLEFGDLYMRVIQNGVLLESGGNPYEIVTPYAEADLSELQFAQSGDVVIIVHSDYAPRELSRTNHTAWTLTAITFEPPLNGPTGIDSSTNGNSGSNNNRYKISSVNEDGVESLPGYANAKNITGATKANPVEITASSHGYVTGDEVYIQNVGGMTELNDRYFFITRTGTNTFTLDDENGTSHTTYTSGGTTKRAHATESTFRTEPNSQNNIYVEWDVVADAVEYIVYKEDAESGTFGYIGTSRNNYWLDNGSHQPDISDTPIRENDVFNATGKYPSTVTYHQQRLGFGGTNNNPEKIWFSRSADFYNFTTRSPLQSDDSIVFPLSGKTVNQVRHMVEVGSLIVLTGGGEWLVVGDSNGILTPTSINPKQQSYNGSSKVAPIVVNNVALYIQARGSIVRDVRYTLESDGYSGQDLTIFSGHLFEGYSITRWDYQQTPNSIVWAVRSDGTLLGLTYLPEQQIWGWHRHDTYDSTGQSVFEDVIAVPEGDEDAVYAVVKRTIDGNTVRYIERMASRQVDTVDDDAKFVDSYLTYDGAPATTITGLDHLEGESVYALADGSAVGPFTVSSGQITLASAASTVHVGLRITSDLETLNLQNPGGAPILQRTKLISQVSVMVKDSFGFQAGPDSGSLLTYQGNITSPFTGVLSLRTKASWETNGRVFIRHTDPLPLTILSIIPSAEVGGN